MDEHDLLELLIADNKKEKEELLSSLRSKTASVAQAVTSFAQSHALELIGAGLGAAVATGLQYTANRKGKSGLSAQQRAARSAEGSHDQSMADLKSEGKKPGYSREAYGSALRATSDIADVMARHPLKSALSTSGVMVGAPVGYTIGRMLARAAKG